MLFNTDVYIFFLLVVVIVNWILRGGLRPGFLLLASYFFYAYWNPPFLLLIIALTLGNYAFGVLQGNSSPRRRSLLAGAIVMDLVILGVFKYLGLLEDGVARLLALFHLSPGWPAVQLILPLGLSFFTFEFIHYQVDLYRGDRPIRDPVKFALFPAFFPTQVAGPIKRYQDFQRQVEAKPAFDPVFFLEGVELIALGMFKKVVLADRLLPIVSTVFSRPLQVSGVEALTGLVAFAFQIYLDFSGYTDIARGSAQLLGYRIPINFNAPYLATSVRDFWRRWHMSLSSWLRDYLYRPLGGSRVGPWRLRWNLMVTMALGGLWHGAAFHFVGWGIGHGAALVANRAWQERRSFHPPIPRGLAIVSAWLLTQATVLTLWSLFRATGVGSALALWSRLIGGGLGHQLLTRGDILVVAAIAGAVLAVELVTRRWDLQPSRWPRRTGVVLRPAFVLALAAITAYEGAAQVAHRFVYFQF
jgi:D-alanyl-lipoteichoic acid acyltransferase DltB (MBOAT superfamily)